MWTLIRQRRLAEEVGGLGLPDLSGEDGSLLLANQAQRMQGQTSSDPLRRIVSEAIEARVQLAVAEAKAFCLEVYSAHPPPATAPDRSSGEESVGARHDGFSGFAAVEARAELAAQEAKAFAADRTAKLKLDVDRLVHNLPALLNALATVPALAHAVTRQEKAQRSYEAGSEARFGQFEAVERRLAALSQDFAAVGATLESLSASLERAPVASHAPSQSHDELRSEIESLRAGELTASRSLESVHAEVLTGREDRSNLWKAAVDANKNIGELWRRIEFVRKEVLYEFRFGPSPVSRSSSRPQLKVVNHALIDAARDAGRIRLNLGCGHVPLPDFINVDARDLPDVDLVADVADLPFGPGTVQEIVCYHLLEHFPQEHARRLLAYWRGLLMDGGQFTAVVPDADAMLTNVATGSYSFSDFRTVLFGGQEYEGDFHFNMYTPESLTALLQDAGFGDIEVLARARKNDICFEVEVVAKAGMR